MRKDTVLDIIKKIPGISYNEIGRETGLSNGVVSHYLIKLMDSGEVEKSDFEYFQDRRKLKNPFSNIFRIIDNVADLDFQYFQAGNN